MSAGLSKGASTTLSANVSPSSKELRKLKEDAMANEWGISDPKVVSMMMKRSKMIKAGAGASGQSAKQRAIPSSSFGGKPKTTKSTKKSSKSKPAWAKQAES